MGSKNKADPAAGALSSKKKHSKIVSTTDMLVPDNSSAKKRKKHSKTNEPPESDFVSETFKKKKLESLAAIEGEASKKKKKGKTDKEEVAVSVGVPKSPKKHSKLEETPVNLVPKSPKKRDRTEKELELPQSPLKKHKKREEAADKAGKESDTPSESERQGALEKKHPSVMEVWPLEDMNSLFSRMRSAIPDDDKLSFHTRQEKIDWNAVAFGEYSGEDCKAMWIQVTRQLRGFRLLSELIDDAILWVDKPWTRFGRKELKKYPDKPTKPLNAFLIYYLAVKGRIQAEHPGLALGDLTKLAATEFRALPPEEKKKYDDQAVQQKEDYLENMKVFEKNHPEIIIKHKPDFTKRRPAQLFAEDRTKKLENSGLSAQQIKEAVKEKWKELSDKKRIKWIKKAAEEHKAYREKLKEYMSVHPDYKPGSRETAILTRKELELLLKDAGRPEKPVTSSLRLYIRDEYHAEIQKGTPQEEVFAVLTARWKELPSSEKKVYIDRMNEETERYKRDYQAYLNSLTDEQREYEELVTQPVKSVKKKKEKDESPEEEVVVKNTEKATFPGEPKKPPSSAYALFLQNFVKDCDVNAADAKTFWNYLPEADKEKFVAKQKEMMEKYMVKFERFLKSLSKEQLAAYKKLYKANSTKKDKEGGSNHTEKSSKAKTDESSVSESDSSESEESEKSDSSESEKAEENSSDDSESESEEEQVVNNNVIIKKPSASDSSSDADDNSDSESH